MRTYVFHSSYIKPVTFGLIRRSCRRQVTKNLVHHAAYICAPPAVALYPAVKLGALHQNLALKFVVGEVVLADMMPDGAFPQRDIVTEPFDIKELVDQGNAGGYVGWDLQLVIRCCFRFDNVNDRFRGIRRFTVITAQHEVLNLFDVHRQGPVWSVVLT